MTMNKKWLIAALIVPMAIGSTSVFAKHHGDKGGKHGCSGEMNSKAFRHLDLTDEQKTELKSIREEMKGSMQEKGPEMREQMQALRAQQQALVLADSFDEKQAEALASQMVDAHRTMQVEKMRVMHRMASVLTDEQKQELIEMRAEKMQKCQQKMEQRGATKEASEDSAG